MGVAGVRTSLGRPFRKLWWATAASSLGNGLRLAALPLLAARTTSDPRLIAAVALFAQLPWVVVSLPAGAFIDRLDRRVLMLRSDVFRCVTTAALAGLVVAGSVPIVVVYAVAFLVTSADIVYGGAAHGVVAAVVARDDLVVAQGRLNAAIVGAGSVTGPSLGGFLFAAATAFPFVLDAGSFAISAVLIASLAGRFHPRGDGAPPRQRLATEIREGIRWVWAHPFFRTLALTVAGLNFFALLGGSVLVLYALEVLDLDEGGFGLLLAAQAAGGFVGSLVAGWWGRHLRAGRALTVALLCIGASQLILGAGPPAAVAGAALFVAGIATTISIVLGRAARQAMTPDPLRGRTTTVWGLIVFGTMPLGAAIGGFLARSAGLRAPFVAGGVAILVLALVSARPLDHDLLEGRDRPDRGNS